MKNAHKARKGKPKPFVTTHEAKTQLSKLLLRASEGEEIIIARGSQPIARLVPYEIPITKRRLGRDADSIRIAADFDAPLSDEMLEDFEK